MCVCVCLCKMVGGGGEEEEEEEKRRSRRGKERRETRKKEKASKLGKNDFGGLVNKQDRGGNYLTSSDIRQGSKS